MSNAHAWQHRNSRDYRANETAQWFMLILCIEEIIHRSLNVSSSFTIEGKGIGFETDETGSGKQRPVIESSRLPHIIRLTMKSSYGCASALLGITINIDYRSRFSEIILNVCADHASTGSARYEMQPSRRH